MKRIAFFSNKSPYYEFSNYYTAPMKIDGQIFINNEQYYQSQKFYDPSSKEMMEYYKLITECDSPQKVKDMGNQKVNYRGESWLINKQKPYLGKMNEMIRKYKNLVKIRDDWDEVKLAVMEKGLIAKFQQHQKLRDLLLETGDAEIVEDSPYDSFWGIAKNGQNHLGKLLMKIRDML